MYKEWGNITRGRVMCRRVYNKLCRKDIKYRCDKNIDIMCDKEKYRRREMEKNIR